MTTAKHTPIDDDHFDYEGGMGQCISGFGRNAIHSLREEPETVEWYIEELVRWCRAFNGELQRCRQQRSQLLAALQQIATGTLGITELESREAMLASFMSRAQECARAAIKFTETGE